MSHTSSIRTGPGRTLPPPEAVSSRSLPESNIMRPLKSAPSLAPERLPFGRRQSHANTSAAFQGTSKDSIRPPLPSRPCEACEEKDIPTFYCVYCDGNFCNNCWGKERAHKPGKLGPDGFPHEKADPQVVNRLKETFTPPSDPDIQERMHQEDEDTTWFGIARDAANTPIFQDYGRYATLMANSATGDNPTRYPHLVSFIGQTGAGKSTVVKMLIEQLANCAGGHDRRLFPTPIVGSVAHDNVPTSGDVHLYADPGTYSGPLPILYADCEGLEGGEKTPMGLRHREEYKQEGHQGHHGHGRKRAESGEDRSGKLRKKKLKIARGCARDLAWANSSDTRKRQYAVTELYPRLLYTFSDVIVFVLQNPKVFEASVLSKLLNWAAASLEKSLNQPILPHAIIVLNATDMGVHKDEWDVDVATRSLMNSVKDSIARDAKYRELADYWMSRGKTILTMQDLLECYYSSVRVVRIPRKGRYMLIDEQVTKLHKEISASCGNSYYSKRKAHMLSSSDELHVYLQSAFDHFSQNLDTPFNFMEVAFKNNPIPLDFGGNILKLAVAVQKTLRSREGENIFRELALMVASCIMLDCIRHDLKGSPEELLQKYYIDYCDYALDDFCGLFWPCEFSSSQGRCVNKQEAHTKGHQNKKGKIIGSGCYEANFCWESFQAEWLEILRQNISRFDNTLSTRIMQHGHDAEKSCASKLHSENMREFYRRLGGAQAFTSHSTCFCCLREMPGHPLPCGHILCTPCVKDYGSPRSGNLFQLDCCPLHPSESRFAMPWYIKFKPELAGIRVLSLDGGGVRGIIELEVLRRIEQYIGGKIPIQNFFDLMVGTSTGGIIALGLGVKQWSVSECIVHFTRFVDRAFTPHLPNLRLKGNKYKSRPFEQVLREAFGEEYLFGGQHEEPKTFFMKVAVTASVDTGDRAVVLSNYNRDVDGHNSYTFIRPDDPSHELKIWEVGRATSAAPTFFKPFVNNRTNEGYLDGALFYNNPSKVAYEESKLLWPDVQDLHPDLFLSVGTGHNGRETSGRAETSLRIRRPMRTDTDTIIVPQPRDHRLGFGSWLKNTTVIQFLGVMLNRVDNILNSEQIWQNFRRDILTSSNSNARESGRYERINPRLGYGPPKLDDKKELDKLREISSDVLRQKQRKIARVAHRLIASSFYFEECGPRHEVEGNTLCSGKIRCRFPPGSSELRQLGDFLRNQQRHNFQPFFRIQERNREHYAINKVVLPGVINQMFTRAYFDMGPIEVHVSDKMGATSILLALIEEGSTNEDIFPISGFPRCLVQQAVPRVPLQESISNERLKVLKRKTSRRAHSRATKSVDESANISNNPEGRRDRAHSFDGPSSPVRYPESPDSINDWISRRVAAASIRRPRAPAPSISVAPPPPQPAAELETPTTPSYDRPPEETLPAITVSAQNEVFELPAQPVDVDIDEDDIELERAIAASLRFEDTDAHRRFTIGGTNADELALALELSIEER